jgi:hypothetical protein
MLRSVICLKQSKKGDIRVRKVALSEAAEGRTVAGCENFLKLSVCENARRKKVPAGRGQGSETAGTEYQNQKRQPSGWTAVSNDMGNQSWK